MAGIGEWWASKSTTTKGLLIGGTLATISAIVYFSTRKKEDLSKNHLDLKALTKVDDEDTSKNKEEQVNNAPSNVSKPQVDKSTLPNGGVGCGDVKVSFDKDFDYVKCDGVWYTKSKINAVSPSAKGLYKEWKSLATNKIATERLSRRYPNG